MVLSRPLNPSYLFHFFILLVLIFPSTSQTHTAALHSVSAASAGAIATMLTHPFDVIKACSSVPDSPPHSSHPPAD